MRVRVYESVPQIAVPKRRTFPTRHEEQQNARRALKFLCGKLKEADGRDAILLQKGLAGRIGCKQAAISRWQNGNMTFCTKKFDTVVAIIEELKCRVDPKGWLDPDRTLYRAGRNIISIDPRNEQLEDLQELQIPVHICPYCKDGTPGSLQRGLAKFCRNCGYEFD